MPPTPPLPDLATLPPLLVLRGDDEFAVKQHLRVLCAAVEGDAGLGDLNISRLDGRAAGESDLANAAGALPFLAPRRLVIVEHPLARLAGETARSRFVALLDNLPPSTLLVLVVEDRASRKKNDHNEWYVSWETLKKGHWLLKWIEKAGAGARLQDFRLPDAREMVEWVRREAAGQGGEFTPAAAAALAAITGNDTALASQEITKLLLYVNFSRPVQPADVEKLAAPGGQVSIFSMVDALALGDTRTALRMLHSLLEVDDAQSIFGMVVRQFRLLIQAKEVLLEGGDRHQVSKELKVHDYITGKLLPQAAHFTMPQLEAVVHRLRDMDAAMKSSQMPADLALEVFIANPTASTPPARRVPSDPAAGV